MRKLEFVGLYLAAPLIMAVAFPPGWLFPMLFAITAIGLGLLWRTEGFRWRDLTGGMGAIRLTPVLLVMLTTAAISFVVMNQLHPQSIFGLVLQRPQLMLMIALLYPILSALPQEIVFRPLYFRRYGAFLPKGRAGLILNAAIFSLAHLMYWSWVVAAMTLAGGLVFAWAYETRQSFPLAVVLHAVAGIVLFAFGMGIYFYSGNVTRPF